MRFTLPILLVLLCFSCKCKIRYDHPTVIKELTPKEINFLLQYTFIIDTITSSDNDLSNKTSRLKNKDIIFTKEGNVMAENKKIGTWGKNRLVKLNDTGLEYIMYIFSGTNFKFRTTYALCDNDSIIKDTILLKAKNYQKEIDKGLDF